MTDKAQTPAFRAAALGAILARHYPDATPHRIASVVSDMQSATRSAKMYAIRDCNGWMNQIQEDAAYKRLNKLQADINGALAFAGLSESLRNTLHDSPAKVKLGGDPRGPCGRLIVPGQQDDGFGEGFAIY